MIIKNSKKLITEVKEKLPDYLRMKGVEFMPNGKDFHCFNKTQHKNGDKNPSATLTTNKMGFTCFGCGIKGDIFKACNIIEGKNITGRDFYITLQYLLDLFGILYEVEEYKKNANQILVEEYIYNDKNYKPIYKICRYNFIGKDGCVVISPEKGKPEKKFIAYSYNGSIWKQNMNNSNRVLYNLPAVNLAIREGQIIFFTEGEKCADILFKRFGLCATTTPFGAKSWSESYIDQLKNANVVFIPDNDADGRKYVDVICKDILPIANSIKIINLSENIKLPLGGDIEEWMSYGGTKENLLDLVKSQKVESKDTKEKQIDSEVDEDWFERESSGRTKINPGLLARHIINTNKSINIDGKIYIYKNGYYKHIISNMQTSIVKSYIDDKYCSMSLLKNVKYQWSNDHTVVKSRESLDHNRELLNLKNGMYNYKTKQLLPHSPNYLSTYQYNASYNINATGNLFNKFLDDILPNTEIRALVQEMFGYTLIYNTGKIKTFILLGDHDTGKSTTLSLLEFILTPDKVAHIPLQSISERFNGAQLYGKRANIFGDIPADSLKFVRTFKALTGGDGTQVEKKGQDPFDITNHAVSIFSCNTLPLNYYDQSEAFYERIIIIPFNNVIGNLDPDFRDKLKEESDYILLWAIEGLNRLISNNKHFTIPEESKILMNTYRKDSNITNSFLEERCQFDNGSEISSQELYKTYMDYCIKQGVKASNIRRFQQELLTNCAGSVKKTLITDKRIAGFKGISVI